MWEGTVHWRQWSQALVLSSGPGRACHGEEVGFCQVPSLTCLTDGLRVKKTFPHQVAFHNGVYDSNRNQTKIIPKIR